MAIPMTMVLDHSGNPLSAPCSPSPLGEHSPSTLRPFYVLTRSPSRLAAPSSLLLTSYRIPPVTPLPTSSAYATAFQQLRIAAVKYNGQDNDSVIYPRFGPPPLVCCFQRRWRSSLPFPRARSATVSTPSSAFATFKLMISNNAGGTTVVVAWSWNTGRMIINELYKNIVSSKLVCI